MNNVISFPKAPKPRPAQSFEDKLFARLREITDVYATDLKSRDAEQNR